MRRLIVSSIALLALTGAASAAELSGRITYLNPDDNLMILNSSDRFTLGSGVDASGLLPGLSVNVTYEGSAEQMTATAVDILEQPVAAPVVGAGGAAGGGGAVGGAAGGLGGAAGGLGGAAGGAMDAAPAAPAVPAPAPAPAPAP
ncbi:MAG: hypothetical protein IT535_06250 [Bauldia sp.]|nr:hypothetical protein [Bauldia sp.]